MNNEDRDKATASLQSQLSELVLLNQSNQQQLGQLGKEVDELRASDRDSREKIVDLNKGVEYLTKELDTVRSKIGSVESKLIWGVVAAGVIAVISVGWTNLGLTRTPTSATQR